MPTSPLSNRTYSQTPLLPEYRMRRSSIPQGFKSRRWSVVYLALLLGLSWTAYMVLTRSTAAEYEMAGDLGEAARKPQGDGGGSHEFGSNAQPGFKDLIKVLDLPHEYVPETGKNRKSGRLVIVGDVHGMKDSLVRLLEKVGFDEKNDHLILAGDMISKGPDSVGVVDLAMKLGATGIRGNHEDRIILAHADMVAGHAVTDQPGPSEAKENAEDSLEEESFSHGDYKDRALVKELGDKRIEWLKNCPVILRVGALGSMGNVVVVHAGLAPGVKLEKQDPTMVMNMRTIGKDGVPSQERSGPGWMKAWNKYQKRLPKRVRTTVIYGHDSKRGLTVEDYSTGIDTGCLKGGKLTAVVIAGKHTDHTHKIVQVKCKNGR